MSGRDYPERPILAVSTAVLRDGAILLARRADGPGAGRYSLPGGVVEIGETLAEAGSRELMEEVSVAARPFGFIGARDVILRDASGRVARHFVVVTQVADWVSGEGAISPEATDIRWVRPGAFADLAVTDGLSEVLEAAWEAARRR